MDTFKRAHQSFSEQYNGNFIKLLPNEWIAVDWSISISTLYSSIFICQEYFNFCNFYVVIDVTACKKNHVFWVCCNLISTLCNFIWSVSNFFVYVSKVFALLNVIPSFFASLLKWIFRFWITFYILLCTKISLETVVI